MECKCNKSGPENNQSAVPHCIAMITMFNELEGIVAVSQLGSPKFL